ncbi:MAG: hypothetical protein SCALA702_21270 [Melioribacteraceae bacterium]|nr:MAG: hypothetical protein SCALA702_21270 [Melioribacteraceae bacterium]
MFKFLQLLSILFISTSLFANGVAIVNSTAGIYFDLVDTKIEASVENQVAVVKSTQTFKNTLTYETKFKYAFPMPENATATQLRWHLGGEWYEASISPVPQDTTTPGGSDPNQNLKTYLGDTPLYFAIEDKIMPDSSFKFEITYVELLPYSFGNVSFNYPNDYSLIQPEPILLQEFEFELTSSRTIDNLLLQSHSSNNFFNNGNFASVSFLIESESADTDIQLLYSLSLDELGLFSFSTYQNPDDVPDDLGNGYFAFVAEPDASENNEVIEKVFTLIIDRSGSMSGDKIVQAKNAATYIINNLNEGDKFNIVDFQSLVYNFQNSHVEFNSTTQTQAINYISSINAGGGTNISGSFDVAVPQFSTANDSTANIIIFLTDGEATAGITHTPTLIEHIDDLISGTETNISLFTFGIGSYVNEQLLSQIAIHNNGFARYLGNDELEVVITQFYNQIRNPVLLDTKISFSGNAVQEVYPVSLPNLFKGQQLIASGRYTESTPTTITFSGNAFGQPVSYQYELSLADSVEAAFQFLPKVWAKQKIEHLMALYYAAPSGSNEQELLKEEIITISTQYGVITEFTSFSVTSLEDETDENREIMAIPEGYVLHGNYPNPFNPSTTIRFSVGDPLNQEIKVRIFNSIGEVVRTLTVEVNGSGYYEVKWDGMFDNGISAPSGVYFYIVDFEYFNLIGKMILLK